MKPKCVCLITSPFLLRASLPPLSNLVTIVSALTPEFYVITGGLGKDLQSNSKANVIVINYESGSTVVTNVIRFIYAHAKIVCSLARLKNVDTCIFFMGERTLMLPLIASKLLKKKIVYISSGSLIKPSEVRKPVVSEVIGVLEHINHIFSDVIILYSSRLVNTDDYMKAEDKDYRHKILIAHRHFLDFNTFSVTIPLLDRPPLIGYIGRLSGEKGIQHFARALPAILNEIGRAHV